MSFEKFTGQPMAGPLLQQWLAKQTTQPLVFHGPKGAGKYALALETAKALNCQEKPREGCGRCNSCRKTLAGTHPDVRTLNMAYQAAIRGEPLEKQQTLKIETVLEERKRLYQSYMEGPWKVSILDDAHRLTLDAANVLLKVLEEPPERTAIFLITPYRDRLFATILSRCQSVRFRGKPAADLPDPEISALWSQLPKQRPSQILSRSEGRGKTSAAQRVDVEEQLQRLLAPAVRDFHAGKKNAPARVELIQKAQQQLRQNVPAALVYDHLLIKLSQTPL